MVSKCPEVISSLGRGNHEDRTGSEEPKKFQLEQDKVIEGSLEV